MRKIEHLLNELESNQLQTILAPSKRHDRREFDFIRVNCGVNPKWYREFCAEHPSSRGIRRGKFDTKIRRQHTLTATLCYPCHKKESRRLLCRLAEKRRAGETAPLPL